LSPSAAVLVGVRVFAWAGFAAMAWKLSATDARIQKIQHRELVLGAWLSLGAYVLLAADTGLGMMGWTDNWLRGPFYADLFIHLALTAAAAIGLWRLRIWPAGDAKLYLLIGAVAPLLTRVPDFQGGRYFFSALINVFLPACAYVAFQVGAYLWETRLKHAAGFLRQAGWKRLGSLSREGAVESARRGWHRTRVIARAARRNPRAFARQTADWIAMLVAMSGFSAAAHSLVPSGAARAALSVAVLYGVMRDRKNTAKRVIWAAAAATIGAYFLLPATSPYRAHLTEAAGALTVFGFFLQFGASWTMNLVGGRVAQALIPFAGMILGTVLMALGAFRSALNRFHTLLELALLGAFFGLCHVFVTIWEREDRPMIPLDKLRPYMLPHREFIAFAERDDPDFVAIHFSELYADGMTPRQVRAARGWSQRRGLDAVPIQTTISFAFWIFFGYFLTWALGGSLLERVL